MTALDQAQTTDSIINFIEELKPKAPNVSSRLEDNFNYLYSVTNKQKLALEEAQEVVFSENDALDYQNEIEFESELWVEVRAFQSAMIDFFELS